MKWSTALQYKLEYGLFRLIVETVRLFPVDTSAEISGRIWKNIAPRTRRHKRALENLKIAFPDKSDDEREKIALSMWENLGRVMAETMQMDKILSDSKRVHLCPNSVLKYDSDEDAPIVVVSLHTGNWELTMSPLTAAGLNPGAVYRLVKNPYVDKYIRKIRTELYPGGLFAKGKARALGINAGQKTARKLINYIRKGGRLGVLCDLHDKQGLSVNFFGQNAKSTPMPAMMARKMGSRIWLMRCVRIGSKTQFRIELKELEIPHTADTKNDIFNITSNIQAQFEDWIRQYPEQWMWSNRRWS